MTTQSRWRERARRVILQAFATLPDGATPEQKRAAANAAYPFGERAMHPYKMWCAELRAQLGVKRPKSAPAEIASGPSGVRCGWCESKGCLACSSHRDHWCRRRDSTDWLAWCEWRGRCCDGDSLTRLAFADWLEERGWDAEAARQRRLSHDAAGVV